MLWVMVLLAALAVTLRIHMSSVVQSVRMTEDRAAARSIADAGLAAAAARIRVAMNDATEPVSDRMNASIELPSGHVDATIVNEALRIDLNRAEPRLIAGMLVAAGATRDQARTLSEEIVALRPDGETPDEETPGEDEVPVPLDPRSALEPFQSVDALALMEDMPATLAIGAAQYATVSSGLSGLRLDGADPELLASIPGLSPAVVAAIEGWRAGRLTRAQLDLTLSDVELHTSEKSDVWRLALRISLNSGHMEAQEALILVLENDTVGYRVLDWRRTADELE